MFHSPTMLAVFAFHAIMIAVVLLPAAAITAVLAFAFRANRLVSAADRTVLVLIGTIVPALIAAHGFHLAWPWPSMHPDALHDGLGVKGSLLVVASGPSWVACLAVSWLVLRRARASRPHDGQRR